MLSSRGDLTVKSYAEDNFNLTALTWATLSQNPDSGGSFAKISLSGAVAVGSYTNTATTTIVAGATLNAAGTMTLDSQAIQPIQLRILDWIAAIKAGPTFEPEPGTSPQSDDPITNGQQVDASTTEKFAWVARQAGILKDWFFNTLLGPISPYTYFAIGEYVTSTTVEAVSGGSRTDQQGNEELTSFGATGTVMVLNIVNTASTVVGAGAALNTRPDGDFAVTAEDDQKVEITSTSSVEFVADAGIAALTDLLYFFKADGVKGKVGIGGTAQQITVTTSADAHVEDGVTIAAKGGVAVRSVDHSLFVVATQQLGEAEKVGVIGAYTLLKHTGTSLAYLEDTVAVNTGDTGNLTVDAGSDSLAVTVSGVMQRGGVVAVGAGVSINAFDITTRAFIGNADGSRSTAPPPADGVSLAVGGALTVTAHSKELLVAVGIAATVPSGGNEAAGNGQPAPAGANAALNNAGGQAGQGNSASFGFGLSASVSVNFIGDFTQAYVDVPGTVNVGGALSITATTTTRAITVAAALLPVREPAKTEITLAGSFVWNEISGQKFGGPADPTARRITSAWLSALKVTAASVTVSATNTEFVVAVGAAIGLVLPKQTPPGGGDPTEINLAGAGVVNRVLTETVAAILSGTTVDTTADVTVNASRDLTLISVTGALLVQGTAAVGAGVQYNKVDDVVYATVEAAAGIDAGGNILVLAGRPSGSCRWPPRWRCSRTSSRSRSPSTCRTSPPTSARRPATASCCGPP